MADVVQDIKRFVSTHWVTLVVGLVVLFIYRYGIAPFTVFKRLGIPGPFPLPFLGNTGPFFLDPNSGPKCQLKWYKKYGKVFGVYFFYEPFLTVADPDMIKDILVKEFPKFHDRKSVLDAGKPYNRMLSIIAGQKWKDIRSTLTPTFSSSKMKQMMPFMNEAVNTLLQKMDKISKTGEIVDFHRWFQSLTLEIILSTAFGIKADTQTVENDPITALAKKVMTPHPLLGLLLILPFGKHLVRFLPDIFGSGKLLSLTADIIAERSTANGKGIAHRKDMLQLMIESKEETGGENIDNEDIQAQCAQFLLAGYETSSTTLGFICYQLALNTHFQDKVRDEADRLWPGDEESPSYEVLHKMEYLDMVINEALRMFPPGFALQRECTEACTINGVYIPKGMAVMVPCYALHHDPDIWAHPEKFDPERFYEEEKAKRHPYTFMPFGFGPHNCIGMRFALLEIKLTLVKLLKKYKLESTEKTAIPLDFVVGAVLSCPPGKIMLKVSQRE